jgi:hypothetical protein
MARALLAHHDKFGLHDDSSDIREKVPLNVGLGHRIGSDVEHFWGSPADRLFNGNALPGGLVKLSTNGRNLAI